MMLISGKELHSKKQMLPLLSYLWQLHDAEERLATRREGDAALQKAVDAASRSDFAAARTSVARARAAYEKAGAGAMQAAVEEIEAAIAEAEAAEAEAAAEADAEAAAAAAAKTEAEAASAAKAAKSAGAWRRAEDPETGDVYYYHTETKETSWDRPFGYDSEEDERLLAAEHEARLAAGSRGEEEEGDTPPPPGSLLLSAAETAEEEKTLGGLDAKVHADADRRLLGLEQTPPLHAVHFRDGVDPCVAVTATKMESFCRQ